MHFDELVLKMKMHFLKIFLIKSFSHSKNITAKARIKGLKPH